MKAPKSEKVMSNIVDFAGFKTEQSWYPEWLKEALNNLPQNIRDEVREAMESSVRKYVHELNTELNISIPSGTTEEQKNSILSIIEGQRKSIVELIQLVAAAKAEIVLNKYTKS